MGPFCAKHGGLCNILPTVCTFVLHRIVVDRYTHEKRRIALTCYLGRRPRYVDKAKEALENIDEKMIWQGSESRDAALDLADKNKADSELSDFGETKKGELHMQKGKVARIRWCACCERHCTQNQIASC